MAKALALCRQLGCLRHVRRGGLDLGELEAQQVQVAFAGPLAIPKVGELGRDRLRLGVCRPVLAPALQVLGPGEAVEDLELGRGKGELAVLVLAVERQQPRPQELQVGGRGRAPGDEGAGAPGGPDAPPKGDLGCAVRQPLRDLRQLGIVQQPVRDLEGALHPRLLGARPDDLRPRPPAHQQVQRVGQHGLAGSGLAGNRVQAGPQAKLGPLDQEQVLDTQLVQHSTVLAAGADGFAPRAPGE